MCAISLPVSTLKKNSFLFILLLITKICVAQIKPEDPEAKLKQEMPDTARISLLKNLSSARSATLPPQKFYYANELKKLAEKLHNEPAEADAYINMGISYAMRSKYDSAIYYFNIGYNRAEKAHYESAMGRSLVNTGYSYDHLDYHLEAIKYYADALAIFKKIKLQKGIDQCNNNIGSIYYDLGQYKTAETYFNLCMASYTKNNDQAGMGYALYSLGNCAQIQGRDSEALDDFNRSMAIRQKLNDLNGIGLTHRGLGIVYMHLKQYDKSLSHLMDGLKIVRSFQDKYEEAAILEIVVQLYVAMKDYHTAETYAKQGLDIGHSMKVKTMVEVALEGLVLVYNSQHDIARAYKYQSQLISIRDSIQAEKEIKDITMAEVGRMRTENASLAKNNQNYAQQISHDSDVIVITSITLVSVILLALLLYRRNLEKQASNKLLSEQKEEIANINYELEALNEELSTQIELTYVQNEELERLNGIKNKFFSIISHDLRGPLITLRSLFGIYREGDIQENEMAMMLNRLEDTILTTGEFLDNLLEWSKSQLEGIVINPINFDITQIIKNNIHLFETKIIEKHLKVTNVSNGAVIVHADQNMIDLVIRNLLSNSVKFCKAGDEIGLSANINGGVALIGIHDTGPGFSETDKQKLFSLEHIVSTGAQGEKGNHLGLILCRDMVVQNNGNIWLESKEGDGTTFWIELPLA